MNAGAEQWKSRLKERKTLTQQIHDELIAKGLIKRSPFSRGAVPDSADRPDLSLYLQTIRDRRRNAGVPAAFAQDDDAPSAIKTPAWFTSEGEYDVSVIVPLYKSRECVQSQIASWDLPDDSLRIEVVYVDDCCPQNTFNVIVPAWEKRREHLNKPVGKIVRRIRNGGFSAACNTGARYASGKYLAFVNADVTVTPNWLHRMIACIASNEQVGIVGNLHLKQLPQGGVIVNSCGSEWHWMTGNFEHIGGRPPTKMAANEMARGPREMVNGGCFLIDGELFWSVGGFDAGYAVGYWEDSDLCMKVRSKGREVWFEPSSVIYHSVGHTGISGHSQEANNRDRFHQRWVRTAIVDRYVSQKRNYEPKSILIRRLGATGDVLVASSVAAALKRRYPSCKLYFQTVCRDILSGNPFIDEVVNHQWSGETDAVFNLDFASERLPYENFLSAFASAAGEKPEDCRFFVRADEINIVPEAGKYVVMHIGPTGADQWKGRMWPQDRFAALAEKIVQDGRQVVVIGDARRYKSETSWPDGVIDLRGKTTLYQMAHVVKHAAAFVGIDSLPFHIAQAFKIPGACIFGSVLPETRIYRGNMRAVTAANVSCLGCHNDAKAPCSFTMKCKMGFEHCMNAVSVEDFYTSLKDAITGEKVKHG